MSYFQNVAEWEPTTFHYQPPTELEPFPVMLTLSPRRGGWLGTRFHIDRTPPAEAANLILSWKVPGGILPPSLWSAVMSMWPRLERVQAGHSMELDGTRNLVGVLTPDAAAAYQIITTWLEDREWAARGDIAPVVGLVGWLGGVKGRRAIRIGPAVSRRD